MSELIGDIEWYRGDSYPLTLTIKSKSTKQAIDITGYAFKLTVSSTKDPPDDSTKLFDVDGDLDEPTEGKVVFTPTATNTDFVPGTYYYDIQMTDINSNIRTIAKYKWKQLQDISK